MRNWADHPSSVVFAILALAAFYLLTLVDGQNWSGDFSLYILHAQNLVEGRHYLDTGYLLNPVSKFVGPYGYPPVFPLLLAPVYAVFGLDQEMLKWVAVASFCISLWLAAKIFERYLEQRWVFFLILVIGLNPYLWDFTNLIRADFTFTVFCYLSLFFMLFFLDADRDKPEGPGRKITASILIGCSMYLAYGTREIGVVLPLTLLTFDIVCRRRISLVSIGALGIFALFAWLQNLWFSTSFIPAYVEENLKNLIGDQAASADLNHLNFVDLNPGRILDRIIGYRWALERFWPPSSSSVINTLNALLFNVFSLLAVCGFIQALFRRITVLEIFLGGYIAVLLLFGAPSTIRYLIPIFPFFLFYGFLFCQQTIFPWLPRLKYAVAGVYFLLLAMISLPVMSSMEYLQLERGITHPDAKAMFRFIRDETETDDTIVFIKPRIMALMTQRQSATWPSPVYSDPETVNRFFDALRADYYVDMNLEAWMLPLTRSEPPSQCFRSVFRNEHFAVYRYEGQSCEKQKSAANSTNSILRSR
ncbi:hypothetical protein FDP08_03780 [Marinobacter panjinensis]|uniref:Glycosyltransferase RgtA/B/C/D-like domain-containing protein n=1 Tax=Marinobacter panjinensis TaxID=2576384 RepID=A0A4U6R378_9GAMM|nr:glycosyltransferase family 39 protein [Marinobacter panjinensis]MCR8915750.1 glycosyltransferase family 39 protein [Marinobacter panjinensis]TKV67268.1 hypothetical protein FDP08_03780 [Marinobacter panjinensis]